MHHSTGEFFTYSPPLARRLFLAPQSSALASVNCLREQTRPLQYPRLRARFSSRPCLLFSPPLSCSRIALCCSVRFFLHASYLSSSSCVSGNPALLRLIIPLFLCRFILPQVGRFAHTLYKFLFVVLNIPTHALNGGKYRGFHLVRGDVVYGAVAGKLAVA